MNTTELETLQQSLVNRKMVLFLDIDGPVIDLHTYNNNPEISHFRISGNQTAIANIVKLCTDYDLKIVTNSMHNYYNVYDSDLKEDLTHWGIPENLFHTEWRTVFPNVDYKKVKSPVRGIGRLYAINEWLSSHAGYNWICFDDRKFTDDPRLIHIQRNSGVDDGYYSQAVEVINSLQGR